MMLINRTCPRCFQDFAVDLQRVRSNAGVSLCQECRAEEAISHAIGVALDPVAKQIKESWEDRVAAETERVREQCRLATRPRLDTYWLRLWLNVAGRQKRLVRDCIAIEMLRSPTGKPHAWDVLQRIKGCRMP